MGTPHWAVSDPALRYPDLLETTPDLHAPVGCGPSQEGVGYGPQVRMILILAIDEFVGVAHAGAELGVAGSAGACRQAPAARIAGCYFIMVPSGATRYQTLPTPWPVTSPGALSFCQR